jgi:hypothetical protein
VDACIAAHKVLPIAKYRLAAQPQPTAQYDGSQPRKKTKIGKEEEVNMENREGNAMMGIAGEENNNKVIIEELNKMLKVYTNSGDKGRKIAYSRAISTIKSLNYELKT